MNFKALFVEVIRTTEDLPALLRDHADAVRGLEEHRFDQSYIEFLDEQIRLNPRGPAWTERLKYRRTALLPFRDVALLRGSVQVGEIIFTVEIQPRTKTVIHYEEYYNEKSGEVRINSRRTYYVGLASRINLFNTHFRRPTKVDVTHFGRIEIWDYPWANDRVDLEKPQIIQVITNWYATNRWM